MSLILRYCHASVRCMGVFQVRRGRGEEDWDAMVSSATTTRNCAQSMNQSPGRFMSCWDSSFRRILLQVEAVRNVRKATSTKTQRHVLKLSNSAQTISYLTNNNHGDNRNVTENKPITFKTITFSRNETSGSNVDYNIKICTHGNCLSCHSSLFWITTSESFPI